MRKISIILISFLALWTSAQAQQLFPYPEPPESLTTLRERTNYLVEHFWERCPMKSAFSSLDKLEDSFRVYVSFMPHAAPDTVHASINALIKSVKNPGNMLTLGQIAERALYNDSAEILSDEVYLPFAQAVAKNKKIPAASRARFEHQARVLEFSQVGAIMNDITFTRPDGSKGKLSDVEAPFTLLFINDPGCDDCRLARARLAADHNAPRLIAEGKLAIVSILPDEIDEEWIESVKSYPEGWTVGAAPDVDDTIDLRFPPVIYLLDKDKKVLGKHLLIDNIINALGLM